MGSEAGPTKAGLFVPRKGTFVLLMLGATLMGLLWLLHTSSIHVFQPLVQTLPPPRAESVANPGAHKYNIKVQFSGRTGNVLFEYASLQGIADSNGMNVVMPKKKKFTLYRMFNISKSSVPEGDKESYKRHRELHWGIWDNRTLHLANLHSNVVLCGYFQSYRYFEKISNRLLQELKFHPWIQRNATDYVDKLKPGIWDDKSITKVGIHARRTDFLSKFMKRRGRTVPGKAYFMKAMAYMKAKFTNVQFIVASDDIEWARTALGQEDSIVYSYNLTAAQDLALIASCDHVIMSVGTFSWWGAWLANGTTIYYENFPKPGSPLSVGFAREDHFPPHWIPMK